METEILEIKALMKQLSFLDTEYRVYGTDCHRYRFGPTLSEAEIAAFERENGIALPADYRLYLQLVGDGNDFYPQEEVVQSGSDFLPDHSAGPGPDNGLYLLAETVQGDKVIQPFPFEQETEIVPDSSCANVPGALEISTGGCLYFTYLIINGPQAGTIWKSWDYTAFWPTGFTFAQWMRGWAQDHIQVFANKPLFDRLKEGMTKDEVIAATGEGWEERQLAGGRLFENDRLRAQLNLDERGIVTAVRSFFWKIRVTPEDW